MKIIVVGKGGREHALVQALADSPSRPQLYAYPGSAGMSEKAERVALADYADLVPFMKDQHIDLCLVGEESYLDKGLVDACHAEGIPAFGPVKDSARLEASKIFAKKFMVRHNVPTGGYVVTNTPEEVRANVTSYPCVLKFDGLAAGKGVTVCLDEAMMEAYLQEVMIDRKFGKGEVVVEEHLSGKELSVICVVCDGRYQVFTPARDYKRQKNNDEGPNTGGMGAVASEVLVEPELMQCIETEVIRPAVDGLQRDHMLYRGFLYFGLMLTGDGPKVIEFNCRFGDPEAEAVLPLVQGDFATYLQEAAQGRLKPELISFKKGWGVCVVLASKDYPAQSSRGEVISGLDQVTDGRVYHAGTDRNEQGAYIVNGGRVLVVANTGPERTEALDRVYASLEKIKFDGAQFRTDIGRLHFET